MRATPASRGRQGRICLLRVRSSCSWCGGRKSLRFKDVETESKQRKFRQVSIAFGSKADADSMPKVLPTSTSKYIVAEGYRKHRGHHS